MRDYRKLKVFQKADQLAVAVFKAVETFPEGAGLHLAAEMRKAALGVPANIVVGSARAELSGLRQQSAAGLDRARAGFQRVQYRQRFLLPGQPGGIAQWRGRLDAETPGRRLA